MTRRPARTEALLVFACAAGAAVLAASEFMTLFEFTPPGGEAISSQEAGDQHGYSRLLLAGMALILLVVAMASASREGTAAAGLSLSRIAAIGVAVCGIVALILFLVGDLPDVNKIGTLDDPRESFIDAKAEPQAGFWLELVGSLVLAVSGAALATLSPDQLRLGGKGGPRERRRRPRQVPPGTGPGEGSTPDEPASQSDGSFRWPARSGERRAR